LVEKYRLGHKSLRKILFVWSKSLTYNPCYAELYEVLVDLGSPSQSDMAPPRTCTEKQHVSAVFRQVRGAGLEAYSFSTPFKFSHCFAFENIWKVFDPCTGCALAHPCRATQKSPV